MSEFYRFPKIAHINLISDIYQVTHVEEEVSEMARAFDDVMDESERLGDVTDGTRIEFGIEVMDVIHASETLLRMCFTDEEVEHLRAKTIEKNDRRRYYDEW